MATRVNYLSDYPSVQDSNSEVGTVTSSREEGLCLVHNIRDMYVCSLESGHPSRRSPE